MQIKLIRDYICAADEAVNECVKVIDIQLGETWLEVMRQVIETGFLEYSTSCQCFVARCKKDLALLVPGDREIIELLPLKEILPEELEPSKVEFSYNLSREQQEIYSRYRRIKLFGPNININLPY